MVITQTPFRISFFGGGTETASHLSRFFDHRNSIVYSKIERKIVWKKSLRTYAHVRDAVRAYYMLVTVDPVAGEYYNIGGVHTCEVGDTLHTLLSMSVMKETIICAAGQCAGRARRRPVGNQHIRKCQGRTVCGGYGKG